MVWEIARQIPSGKVATYGQIAALIPCPAGMDEAQYNAFRARWAGQAMAGCPGDVPWQRVINSQGKISPRGGEGVPLQRKLLEQEGVRFDARDRVDLKAVAWSGPPRDWLQAHGLVTPPEDYHQQSLI
jgi:methylated-DNA-protein-cysteine methyltransferase-like protein